MNIIYFEVAQNLVWKNVLQTILKDLPGFIEDGGWATVLGGSDEENEDEDLLDGEKEDSEFTPGGSESDEDFSDDELGEEEEEEDELIGSEDLDED